MNLSKRQMFNLRDNKLTTTSIFIKFLNCLAIYVLYNFGQNLNIFALFAVVYSISFLLLYAIQSSVDKCFSLQKLKIPYIKFILYSILNVIHSYLWLQGLFLSGPIRSIFLIETSDILIIAIFITINQIGQQTPSKIRGTFFYIGALLVFSFFDHDDQHFSHNLSNDAETNFLVKVLNLSDHKKGICLLILSIILKLINDKLIKKLSIQIGGIKITQLLLYGSQFVVCVLVSLYTQFIPINQDWVGNDDSNAIATYWLPNIFSTIFIAVVMYVANFYINTVCAIRFDKYRFARVATLTSYGSAYVIHMLQKYLHQSNQNHPQNNDFNSNQNKTIWDHFLTHSNPNNLDNALDIPLYKNDFLHHTHNLTVGAYFGMILFVLAVLNLTSNAQKSCRGQFVGYSTFSGLPLYEYTAGHISTMSHSFKTIVFDFCSQISRDKASRPIFYFLIANLLFMLVEILYGAWSNSLGLISDGFHMLFDCSALVMGLVAALMARWKPTKTFTYGYGRAEVLSGFLNGLFLLLVSVNVFIAALDRLFEPPRIESEQLLLVSVIGLIINLIGIFAFHLSGDGGCSHHGHSHSSHHGGEHAHHDHHSHNENERNHHHHSDKENEHHHHHSHNKNEHDTHHHHHHGHHHHQGSQHAQNFVRNKEQESFMNEPRKENNHEHHGPHNDQHPHLKEHDVHAHKHDDHNSARHRSPCHQHQSHLLANGSIPSVIIETSHSNHTGPYSHSTTQKNVQTNNEFDKMQIVDIDVPSPSTTTHSHVGGHSHGHNMNMRGIFLHVLADALGSVGVILSSFLMQRYGWYIADPICSLFTSTLIFLSVLPLLRDSFNVLALKTPEELGFFVSRIRTNVSHLPYVKSILNLHIWKLSNSVYVATLRVLIDISAPPMHERVLQSEMNSMFISALHHELGSDTVQCQLSVQVDRDTFYDHLNGIAPSYINIMNSVPSKTNVTGTDSSHILDLHNF